MRTQNTRLLENAATSMRTHECKYNKSLSVNADFLRIRRMADFQRISVPEYLGRSVNVSAEFQGIPVQERVYVNVDIQR